MKGRCAMLVIILFIVAHLPTTACQCMEYLSYSEACSDKVSPDKIPFVQCIDMCLAQSEGNCYFIEWNRRTHTCYMGREPWQVNFADGTDCITMKKDMCTSMTDRVCLEDAGGHLFEGGEEVKGLSEGKECSTMCVLSQECLAYTWLESISTCKLHLDQPKRSGERLKEGDMQLKKPSTPRKGRCTMFRAGGCSTGGQKVFDDLQDCIRSLSSKRPVVKADWNFTSNTCWLHYKDADFIMLGTTFLLQLYKIQDCTTAKERNGRLSTDRLNGKTTCFRKRKRPQTGMTGGYQIVKTNEEACVELCLSVVNCAAVHFDRRGGSGHQSCFFHHEEKTTFTDQYLTLYTFNELEPKTVLSTILPTTVKTTTTIIKTTTAEPKTVLSTIPPTTVKTTTSIIKTTTGTMLWSFYKSYDENMAKGFPRHGTCIECALLCLQFNCTGFTCGNMENGDRCNINVTISKRSYIPFTP